MRLIGSTGMEVVGSVVMQINWRVILARCELEEYSIYFSTTFMINWFSSLTESYSNQSTALCTAIHSPSNVLFTACLIVNASLWLIEYSHLLNTFINLYNRLSKGRHISFIGRTGQTERAAWTHRTWRESCSIWRLEIHGQRRGDCFQKLFVRTSRTSAYGEEF